MFEMISKRLRKSKNQKGFTLIELIVVVAILGILAAIAVPKLSGFSTSAKNRANEANIKTCEGAAQMYIAAQTGSPEEVDLTATNTDTAASNPLASYLKLPLLQPGTSDKGYIITIVDGVVTVAKEQ